MASQTARPKPLSESVSAFGMIVFIASDLMIFAAFFAAYFLLRSVNPVWPSPEAELDTVRAGAATVALVASSVTMVTADRHLEAGRVRRYRLWLWATIALGAGFLVNQFLEYSALPFRPSTDAYGSIYWMLTGLHSVHVILGVAALSLLVIRSTQIRSHHDLASWNGAISAFWHVVDVVWIAVFATIWLIR